MGIIWPIGYHSSQTINYSFQDDIEDHKLFSGESMIIENLSQQPRGIYNTLYMYMYYPGVNILIPRCFEVSGIRILLRRNPL